jgi:hypothetical protein
MPDGPETLRQQRPALTTTRKDRAMAAAAYTGEIWKVIPYSPKYEVSTLGRVRRINCRLGHECRRAAIVNRYPFICLPVDGKWKGLRVHNIVAEVFIGPRPTRRHQAAHNDGNPLNCRLDNIRWATPEENAADKIAHGTSVQGARNPKAKLTVEQVHAIRERLIVGVNTGQIAKEFGIAHGTAYEIATGKRWTHV